MFQFTTYPLNYLEYAVKDLDKTSQSKYLHVDHIEARFKLALGMLNAVKYDERRTKSGNNSSGNRK